MQTWQTARLLKGVSSKVVGKWYRTFRFAMSLWLQEWENTILIGGPGHRVQIDESKFGKNKYFRGSHRRSGWVFGIVDEDRSGRRFIYTVCVPDRRRRTLYNHIFGHVAAGTTVVSDNFGTYANLGYHYRHVQVNHSATFSSYGVNTNTIEGAWRHLKDAVHEDGTPRHKYIQSRLDEYVVRKTFFDNAQQNECHFLLRIVAAKGTRAILHRPAAWGRG